MNKPFRLSRDAVRELDRRAIEEYGLPGVVLMENAGRGAADLLRELTPRPEKVLILCGPGNNGGDGFVMARHLQNAGVDVSAMYLGGQSPRGDAGVHYEIARKANLLRPFEADLIVGSKAARGASDQRPLVRRLATRVHNGLLRATLGREVQGGSERCFTGWLPPPRWVCRQWVPAALEVDRWPACLCNESLRRMR